MYGIGVAEQVVHVAQYFLIGTDQEHGEVIVFAFLQRMHRQAVGDMAVGHEVGDFSVRIAGDILYRGVRVRTFVQPLYRHDGEELVYGPCVRQALEQREIAEILVGQ